jgi:hypothetical protein
MCPRCAPEASPLIMGWISGVPSKMVKLSDVVVLSSVSVSDHAFHLDGELWSSVGVFCRFPRADGTEKQRMIC